MGQLVGQHEGQLGLIGEEAQQPRRDQQTRGRQRQHPRTRILEQHDPRVVVEPLDAPTERAGNALQVVGDPRCPDELQRRSQRSAKLALRRPGDRRIGQGVGALAIAAIPTASRPGNTPDERQPAALAGCQHLHRAIADQEPGSATEAAADGRVGEEGRGNGGWPGQGPAAARAAQGGRRRRSGRCRYRVRAIHRTDIHPSSRPIAAPAAVQVSMSCCWTIAP